MIYQKKYSLFFLNSEILFFRGNTTLYIHNSSFLKCINLLDNANYTKNRNISKSLIQNLDSYVDDIEKFNFYTKKRTFSLTKLKNKKSSQKLNISSNTNTLSLKHIKIEDTWQSFVKGRYGIGCGLSLLFTKYNGTLSHSHLGITNFNTYLYQTSLLSFFFRNANSFDHFKAQISFYSFFRHKSRFTFKGWCFLNHYPVNGQKRRTNYKTARNYNQLLVLKIKK